MTIVKSKNEVIKELKKQLKCKDAEIKQLKKRKQGASKINRENDSPSHNFLQSPYATIKTVTETEEKRGKYP